MMIIGLTLTFRIITLIMLKSILWIRYEFIASKAITHHWYHLLSSLYNASGSKQEWIFKKRVDSGNINLLLHQWKWYEKVQDYPKSPFTFESYVHASRAMLRHYVNSCTTIKYARLCRNFVWLENTWIRANSVSFIFSIYSDVS